MSKRNHMQKSARHQAGAVLITSLVLMSIITIIGLTVMRSNTTDISIHKSMKNRTNAFQCAEAALRAGELWLDNEITVSPTAVMTAPVQANKEVWSSQANAMKDLFNTDSAWWTANGWVYGDGGATRTMINTVFGTGCVQEPRFIVESLGTFADSKAKEIDSLAKEGVDWFRISGFSVGTENNASVILQTTYAKRFK